MLGDAMSGDAITLLARAKVNPILRVLGRRDDGHHDVETLLLALELADRVRVRARSGAPRSVRVTTSGPAATPDIVDGPGHLAARGAELALGALGRDAAVEVAVEKHVPSRAGLGGGSSDAAAAAFGVVELLGPRDPAGRARAHARCAAALGSLGADCAFFAGARWTGAAFGAGRGDELDVLAPPPRWDVLLVTPEAACSTPAVYGALTEAERRGEPVGRDAAAALLAAGVEGARRLLVNDLQAAAERAAPGLAAWRALLQDVGLGHALLAGSGSSSFALFEPGGGAREAAGRVRAAARERGLGLRLCVVTSVADQTLQRVDGEEGS